MKKLHLHALFFSVLSLLFASCGKDDDAQPLTKTDFLVQSKWKTTALTVNPGLQANDGTLITNVYQRRDNCINDDLKIFERSNIYKADEGTSKCDPGDPQIFDLGNWSLSDEDTKLVISTGNGGFSSYNIQELTATSLIYTYTAQFQQGGQVYTFTETHTAQQ